MMHLLEELPYLVVAVALVAADVILHVTGHGNAAGPFDAAIPILVAVYVGGRMTTVATRNGGSK